MKILKLNHCKEVLFSRVNQLKLISRLLELNVHQTHHLLLAPYHQIDKDDCILFLTALTSCGNFSTLLDFSLTKLKTELIIDLLLVLKVEHKDRSVPMKEAHSH